MDAKTLLEQLMADNRQLLGELDKEARLYSKLVMEKFATQLDLAYKGELESLEAALERAEQRVAALEERISELERDKNQSG